MNLLMFYVNRQRSAVREKQLQVLSSKLQAAGPKKTSNAVMLEAEPSLVLRPRTWTRPSKE